MINYVVVMVVVVMFSASLVAEIIFRCDLCTCHMLLYVTEVLCKLLLQFTLCDQDIGISLCLHLLVIVSVAVIVVKPIMFTCPLFRDFRRQAKSGNQKA